MAYDNLPPGVTPSDIDDHFGGDPDNAFVTVAVTVDVPARGYNDEQIRSDARETVQDALRDFNGDYIGCDVVNIERR